VRHVANGVIIKISEMSSDQGLFEVKHLERLEELTTDVGETMRHRPPQGVDPQQDHPPRRSRDRRLISKRSVGVLDLPGVVAVAVRPTVRIAK
jgi:hypothetical protein